MNIVTGVFDNVHSAMDTARALKEANFESDHIGVVTRDREKGEMFARDMGWDYTTPSGDTFTGHHVYNTIPDGYMDAIRRSNLPDNAVEWYRHHLDQGHILVITRTGDRMDDAVRIVHSHNGCVYGEECHYGRMAGMEGMERREGMMRETTAREVHMPITDEEVMVEKRERQVGEVRVTSEVTRETRDIPTTVTHEELRVERRKLDRIISPDEYKTMGVDESGVVRMPIIEEEIRVTKRPIIREELVITRMPVSEQKTIRETVTHTEPHVETTGEVAMEGMTEEERMRRRKMPPAA